MKDKNLKRFYRIFELDYISPDYYLSYHHSVTKDLFETEEAALDYIKSHAEESIEYVVLPVYIKSNDANKE